MNTNKLVIIVHAAILVLISACNSPAPNSVEQPMDTPESKCVIFKAESGFNLMLSYQKGGSWAIVVDSDNYIDDKYREWQASMEDVCNSIYEQIVDNGGDETINYAYAYAKLRGLSLRADRELFGVPAGEDLASLYSIKINTARNPLFYYDTFKIAHPIGENKLFSIDEYIGGGYLLSSGLYLVPRSEMGNDTIPSATTFTIVVELSTGAIETQTYTL